jgi:hypothetical protein
MKTSRICEPAVNRNEVVAVAVNEAIKNRPIILKFVISKCKLEALNQNDFNVSIYTL